jgi:hypothetical protein
MATRRKPFTETTHSGGSFDEPTAGSVIFEDEPGWDPGTMGNKRGFDSSGRWVDNSGSGSGPPDLDSSTGQPIIW